MRCFSLSRAARLKVCSKFSSKGSTFDALTSRATFGFSDLLAETLETVTSELVFSFIAFSRFSHYLCSKLAIREAFDLVPKMRELIVCYGLDADLRRCSASRLKPVPKADIAKIEMTWRFHWFNPMCGYSAFRSCRSHIRAERRLRARSRSYDLTLSALVRLGPDICIFGANVRFECRSQV